MQCIYDDGKSEHRVCVFEDLVLWEGQLIYVADGELRFEQACLDGFSGDDLMMVFLTFVCLARWTAVARD